MRRVLGAIAVLMGASSLAWLAYNLLTGHPENIIAPVRFAGVIVQAIFIVAGVMAQYVFIRVGITWLQGKQAG